MYHFFTSPENIDAQKGTARITGQDVNHILNVLRMKAGDQILVSDGEGTDYTCEILGKADEESISLGIISAGGSLSEPGVRFYLFQGLPKSDKFEHIIQKSVELGVYEVIPVQTARSIVKYDEKKARTKRERWQKIAESAAKQSRRGIIPNVREVMTFKEALKYASAGFDMDGGAAQREGDAGTINIIPYENFKDMQSTRRILSDIRPGMSVGIFIGPEGGFEEKEIQMANEAGVRCISLGSRILRTETAPLMLLSVLSFSLEQ